jgi:hypothetical protein
LLGNVGKAGARKTVGEDNSSLKTVAGLISEVYCAIFAWKLQS